MRYKVFNGLDNDKTGNRYEIGDEFDNDLEQFDSAVIDNWTQRGYIEEIAKEKKPKREAKATKTTTRFDD